MIDVDAIVELKVYPPIGVARVGNAEGDGDYVIGPEVIGGYPTLPGQNPEKPARYLRDFRNSAGQIRRQAARFRVYAHMDDGSIEEITADLASIEWTVAVANLKAGWYEFNQAMDLGALSQNALKRNRNFNLTDAERSRLDITPGPRTICGRNERSVQLDDGAFWGEPVNLGELRTDDLGRLIFLGGAGIAKAFRNGLAPLTFANNDGWHDDLCDGPVRARVTFKDRAPMDAEPGYVTVTPPNYAPGLFGVVTMDDVVRELFVEQGWLEEPGRTCFADDILPIFRRLTGLQWVNHGLFVLHGLGSPIDADDPAVVERLGDAGSANAGWRRAIFDLFRDPNARNGPGTFIAERIPGVFGDGVDTVFGSDSEACADGWLAVTKVQYAHLARWASGDFDGDLTGVFSDLPDFPTLSPAEQVHHLERASLHDCLGGPFHPAMEMTWVMRIPLLWKSAYRLNILPTNDAARQDFGDALTPAVCIGANGPFDGAAAGCLTRFLGVPWQTDHTSCNSGADLFPSRFLSIPTFWGPRAPDQVLAQGNFLRAASLSTAGEAAERQMFKHLMNRVDWLRDIRGFDYYSRLSQMITEWADLGMVLPIENPPASLPSNIRVEQGRVIEGALVEVALSQNYRFVEMVEMLAGGVTTPEDHGLGLAATFETTARQSKRKFRPGTI